MKIRAVAVVKDHTATLSTFSDPGIRQGAQENIRLVLVVGDKFQDFSAGKTAMTISQLRGLLQVSPSLIMCERMRLVPGQGLSDEDISSVVAQAMVTGHRDRLDFSLWRQIPTRADGTLSHKARRENTLISEPRRIDDDNYELDLLIDENCELMADHQTGQHLQGMLLIEAARQSFLAVTENYFLPRDGQNFYFVFNNVTAEYKRFAFPIATRLQYCIRDKELAAHNRRFAVDVVVKQVGLEAAMISGNFTAVKARSIAKMERSLAEEVVCSHLAQLADTCSGAKQREPGSHGLPAE